MKCPQCSYQQKVKEGMVCRSCKYRFTLNPKESPYLTDKAFQAALERLSARGHYYFTYNQLYGAVYQLICKKKRSKHIGIGVFCTIFIVIIAFSAQELPVFLGAALIVVFLWYKLMTPRVKHETVSLIIRKYSSVHPISNLVDGHAFKGRMIQDIDPEFLNYAPEKILVVEHNDMADMLILNRLHFETKTLIVSALKYPVQAFRACQEILSKHPDTPVCLVHDASSEGLLLKKKLILDEAWNLRGRDVKDLGLSLGTIDRIKKPIWVPSKDSHYFKPKSKKPLDNINKGMMIPVDSVPPKALVGVFSAAMLMGVPLLSEELMKDQIRDSGSMGGEISFG